MESAGKHFKAYQEGIVRARLIRKDLKNHPTEYYPEKVRGLNKAYIETVKEIIRQGEAYLDKTQDLEAGLEVAMAIENYKAFLTTLPQRDETK